MSSVDTDTLFYNNYIPLLSFDTELQNPDVGGFFFVLSICL